MNKTAKILSIIGLTIVGIVLLFFIVHWLIALIGWLVALVVAGFKWLLGVIIIGAIGYNFLFGGQKCTPKAAAPKEKEPWFMPDVDDNITNVDDQIHTVEDDLPDARDYIGHSYKNERDHRRWNKR